MKSIAFASLILGVAALAPAQINSVVIHNRVFNDDPDSVLVTTNTYPTLIEFNDSKLDGNPTGGGGFANRHVWYFSANGTTDFAFTNNTFFDVKMDVSLTGLAGSVKEAGFLLNTQIAGQGQFIVKTNGEIAAFGGPLPFVSFQPAGSVVPATITLGMRYFLDTDGKRKITYTAGANTFTAALTNLEQGIIDGSNLGGYAQYPIISGNAQNFGDAKFANIRYVPVPVPEPTTMAALGLGLAAVLRRRRNR